jgi:hypothetical protein
MTDEVQRLGRPPLGRVRLAAPRTETAAAARCANCYVVDRRDRPIESSAGREGERWNARGRQPHSPPPSLWPSASPSASSACSSADRQLVVAASARHRARLRLPLGARRRAGGTPADAARARRTVPLAPPLPPAAAAIREPSRRALPRAVPRGRDARPRRAHRRDRHLPGSASPRARVPEAGQPDVDLGPLENFPEGQYYVATFERRRAGRRLARTRVHPQQRRPERQPSFTIISNRCVHLGCPVQPDGPSSTTKKTSRRERASS